MEVLSRPFNFRTFPFLHHPCFSNHSLCFPTFKPCVWLYLLISKCYSFLLNSQFELCRLGPSLHYSWSILIPIAHLISPALNESWSFLIILCFLSVGQFFTWALSELSLSSIFLSQAGGSRNLAHRSFGFFRRPRRGLSSLPRDHGLFFVKDISAFFDTPLRFVHVSCHSLTVSLLTIASISVSEFFSEFVSIQYWRCPTLPCFLFVKRAHQYYCRSWMELESSGLSGTVFFLSLCLSFWRCL